MNVSGTLLEVRKSPVHGLGVFATRDIPAGTLLGEYAGELISAAEAAARTEARSRRDSRTPIYIFELDAGHFIDASAETDPSEKNFARFINHSCDENCEALARERRIEIRTIRNVRAGEELSLDYGFALAGFFERPCRCGAKNCVHFIVAKPLRPALLRKLAARSRARSRTRS